MYSDRVKGACLMAGGPYGGGMASMFDPENPNYVQDNIIPVIE